MSDEAEGARQPAREGVQVAHVDLAPLRQLQLPPQPGRQLAHHHGDDDEQKEVDHLLRVGDAQAVKRRKEEEGGRQHAADRRDDGRHDAPADGRDQHRQEVDHRAVAEPAGLHGGENAQRHEGDQADRQDDAAQLVAQPVQSMGAQHDCVPLGGLLRPNIAAPLLSVLACAVR